MNKTLACIIKQVKILSSSIKVYSSEFSFLSIFIWNAEDDALVQDLFIIGLKPCTFPCNYSLLRYCSLFAEENVLLSASVYRHLVMYINQVLRLIFSFSLSVKGESMQNLHWHSSAVQEFGLCKCDVKEKEVISLWWV